MKIKSLGSYYQRQIAVIEDLAQRPSLWQAEAATLLPKLAQNYKRSDSDELLGTLSDAQRLDYIAATGLENDPAFKTAVASLPFSGWKDFTAPPVPHNLHKALADKLYNAKPGVNDHVSMRLGDGARIMGPILVNKCLHDKVPFVIYFVNPDFHATLLNHATPEGVQKLGQNFISMADNANKSIIARSGMPDHKPVAAQPDKVRVYNNETAPHFHKTSTGEMFYTLTAIPTRKDAEIDGIEYNDYIKLFFEMCDQPWHEVSKAQSALIKEFNAASNVRITNDDGTDVSMELVDHDGEHFTFCNSLIAKNVPGSEIFSAPRRDSVNGTVVAKGRFYQGGLIENLTMEFKNGELVSYHAEQGEETFRRAVTIDDGARYIGELGIGTNPHLKRHVTNGLLVEKIGGSFHLALGRPYSYTEYGGEPVKVDNGGKSDLHWDVTTMLHGKGGCIYLDNRKVMENGQWLDAQYDVLNRGWEALPRKERPTYWKNYFDKPKGP